MKRRLLALLGTFSLLLVASCDGLKRNYIDARAFNDLVTPVLERHDKFLNGELDPSTVSEDQKRVWLRSTELLRLQLSEAMK